MAVLDKSDISMLLSLVVLEMERCGDIEDDHSYRGRLLGIRNRLLAMLAKTGKLSNSGDVDLPEFREYARTKYGNELNEDMIIMFEDLIEMRRQVVKRSRG